MAFDCEVVIPHVLYQMGGIPRRNKQPVVSVLGMCVYVCVSVGVNACICVFVW